MILAAGYRPGWVAPLAALAAFAIGAPPVSAGDQDEQPLEPPARPPAAEAQP